MANNRITPENITELQNNEVFVFGSNKAGRHGKGAALQALSWGATPSLGEGPSGKTYAIPTKDYKLKPLNIEDIRISVKRFEQFASNHPEKTFLVTEIGCGLAGFTPQVIAPLFRRSLSIENVHLPIRFWSILSVWIEIEAP